ncbi:PREDICTED: Fanconi anemia group E protein [Cyprinodon variegatus]|uniref:Fanconi anemia group E protein n=1 Tax=Cyprinodon variegatus TaxID=28743 RepID=UPI0007428813|nr:PREDICTED: Fanconi anemia group E protein [Cyprinodon variegatus]
MGDGKQRVCSQRSCQSGSCLNSCMPMDRFDGQSRLLLRALMSGFSGAKTALSVFHRQQRANQENSLVSFIQTLCRDEVASPEDGALTLTVKPLVCLLPPLFKQNLLTFLYLLHPAIPVPAVLLLLKCLGEDSTPTPWVTAMVRQLERKLEVNHTDPLYSEQCSQKLKTLSERLGGFCETGGWADCFISQTEESESHARPDLSQPGTQRKRRASLDHVEADSKEMVQESKRMKMDEDVEELVEVEDEKVRLDTGGGSETPANRIHDDLPEHIRGSVLLMQELLESQAEWDQSSADVFQVLNECNPNQVEMLCKMLNFPILPEDTLPKLCNGILCLSPDLSYSAAASLIRSVLLEKVSSLSEPPSRCLVTAVTSLCSRYPRPMCLAVIEPVLQDRNIGPPQTELLNRLIENCLDVHYRLLVLQMTFRVPWSEAVLSVHSLLDHKLVLSEEVFTQLTEQLISQGSQFTKSVKFAKMMLTVLTKYSSHVTAAQKHSLAGCLSLNETFLKKSLQAALKRIPDT